MPFLREDIGAFPRVSTPIPTSALPQHGDPTLPYIPSDLRQTPSLLPAFQGKKNIFVLWLVVYKLLRGYMFVWMHMFYTDVCSCGYVWFVLICVLHGCTL